MRKTTQQKGIIFSVAFFFFTAFVFEQSSQYQDYSVFAVPVAHADDDEDEEDDDEDEDEDEGNEGRYEQKTVKVKPVYKTVYVEKVTITLDPIFTRDTDRDLIVDGLDPHPTISEKEYFTDDDEDGIANAFDMHEDEDDFAYYEQEDDANENGILDSYEVVAVD